MFTSRSKRNVRDLAILGGKAAFKQQLYVGRPNIGNRERLLDRINDILDRRWLTNQGPFVCEFETRISEILGVKHCIATCNATIGLAIAIRALGMTGEVIIPSFTFVATAHALQWQQVSPVFGDIDERSHNLDPRRVESLITPRTTGILATHLWGRPCEVFSFHATKFLNTFEGGAIVTNDDDLAEKIRLMTNYGFAGYDRVIHLGINGKMSEIAAAMGLTGLESMAEFIVINRDHYKRYLRALKDIPGIEMIRYDEDERNNYQYIVLEIDETKTHISRDLITSALHAENVLARRYFYPGCHRMEPYRSYSPHAELLLSATEQLSERVLSLPTGTTVDANDIDLICDLIRFLVAQGAVISEQVSASTADHP
jgi:dTDP-4-amino-4,6-dideoxygalactose transaminase